MRGKKWIGLILFLAFVGFVGYSIYSSQQEDDIATVRTAEVTEEDITDTVVTSGMIEPSETQEIIGQGLVTELNVSVGDTVEEGDTLLTYVDGTTFEADFDGTVTQVNVAEDAADNSAQQGRPSLVIANLTDLKVALQLSRSDASEVEVDQAVILTYNDTEFEGTVSEIDPVATQQQTQTGATTQLGATVTFDSDTSGLIAGFEIDVDIIVDSEEGALVIPVEALNYNENNEPYVFIVTDGIAERADIETGIQSEAIIEVTNGVSAGDQVVLSPGADIEDGLEVELEN
ncbi:HlyD family secretion protein [Alkalibacterium subtropicum]|uniref:HlyD family secretion protein n=1 Tax=Alkalibacterium subtropicum TaxID=753702 RepID=A0A1I1HV52_9LACT|nr:HlyD family efflux transporter periplasmic adaptor subunit [Alkalibacterium subtropicum]SFC27675.1 HlyD family secretion protein [Alkalibacterium subtropicum]